MEVENIGNWLYFLFIIIAGISSLFSSKKKGKRIQQKEYSDCKSASQKRDSSGKSSMV